MGKVLVTGATGLLGRAVASEFEQAGWDVVRTGLSRADGKVIKHLDLTATDSMKQLFEEEKPNVVVHCAAERRPDVAESEAQREQVLALNVESSRELARVSRESGALLIYISTDYVFDGKNPPYKPTDEPNPLNFYGKSKRLGEVAVLETDPSALVVRVPVLYGQTEKNSESAIVLLIDVVESKPADMDNVQARYPTNTADIGRILVQIAERYSSAKDDKSLPHILHISAPERFTKYEMSQIFAEMLSVPMDHLRRVDVLPAGASVSRPNDCHLDTSDLERLGIKPVYIKFRNWAQHRLLPRY